MNFAHFGLVVSLVAIVLLPRIIAYYADKTDSFESEEYDYR